MISEAECVRLSDVLVANLRREHARLAKLDADIKRCLVEEDGIYRLYHGSFKVYSLQDWTKQIADALGSIAPEGQPFCRMFNQLLRAGTELVFTHEVNQDWLIRTAPIVQAFLHAQYFLEMAVKYGLQFEKSPQSLPFGFAALLELYGIR